MWSIVTTMYPWLASSSTWAVFRNRVYAYPGENSTTGCLPGRTGAPTRACVWLPARSKVPTVVPMPSEILRLRSSAAAVFGGMYFATGPESSVRDGYQTLTISSRLPPGAAGSFRAGSTRCSSIVPRAYFPVGAGRSMVCGLISEAAVTRAGPTPGSTESTGYAWASAGLDRSRLAIRPAPRIRRRLKP